MTFGAWLRLQREALGLTRKQFAACVGCSAATIRKIEDEERRPSRQMAALLAKCLGIAAEDHASVIQAARGERSAEWLPAIAHLPTASAPIPVPPVPLVDRQRELDRIAELLSDPMCRLITIVGVGGIGKTHLALEAAQREAGRFRHGVQVVELAPVESVTLLPSAMMYALQIPAPSGGDPKTALLDFLSEKQCLLLLDNFEHLLDAVGLVDEILAASPECKMIVTSRERLNIRQEWLLPLEGLSYASLDGLARLEDYGAVMLFDQRARRVRPDFSLAAHGASVMKICRLVEGMPLAIELAASCLHVMTATQIADQLTRWLDVLSTSARDVPERHRSVRAALDVSWNLLSQAEQDALLGVAIFTGTFDLEAAQSIAGASPSLVGALVEKSVARLRPDARYDLHPLIRRYAAERLDAASAHAISERHREFYLHLAEAAAPRMDTADEAIWLDRLEGERDNLHSALVWSRNSGDVESLARICSALRHFWAVRGSLIEGYEWLKIAVSRREHLSTAVRAAVLFAAGTVAWSQRDQQQGMDWLTESLALSQQIGDTQRMAWALRSLATLMYSKGIYKQAWEYAQAGLALARSDDAQSSVLANLLNLVGMIAAAQGDYAEAQTHFAESLDLYRAVSSPSRIVLSLRNLGRLALRQSRYPEARAYLEEGIQVAKQINDVTGVASLMALLAGAALGEGHLDEALALASEALALAEMSHDEVFVAQSCYWLGAAMLERGEIRSARSNLSRSLTYYVQVEQKPDAILVLMVLARIAAADGDPEKALRLFAAIDALCAEISLTLGVRDQALYSAEVGALREMCSPERFEALWAEGAPMTLEQAAEIAMPTNQLQR